MSFTNPLTFLGPWGIVCWRHCWVHWVRKGQKDRHHGRSRNFHVGWYSWFPITRHWTLLQPSEVQLAEPARHFRDRIFPPAPWAFFPGWNFSALSSRQSFQFFYSL